MSTSGQRGRPTQLIRDAGYSRPEFPLSNRAREKYEEIRKELGVKNNLFTRMAIIDLAFERLHEDLTMKKKRKKYDLDGHLYEYFLKKNGFRLLKRMIARTADRSDKMKRLKGKLQLEKEIRKYLEKE